MGLAEKCCAIYGRAKEGLRLLFGNPLKDKKIKERI